MHSSIELLQLMSKCSTEVKLLLYHSEMTHILQTGEGTKVLLFQAIAIDTWNMMIRAGILKSWFR